MSRLLEKVAALQLPGPIDRKGKPADKLKSMAKNKSHAKMLNDKAIANTADIKSRNKLPFFARPDPKAHARSLKRQGKTKKVLDRAETGHRRYKRLVDRTPASRVKNMSRGAKAGIGLAAVGAGLSLAARARQKKEG